MDRPSITDLLIATLMSGRNTKTFRSILREREFKRYKDMSVQVTLSRLHKKGYISSSSSGWSLTRQGRRLTKEVRLTSFLPSPFKKDSLDNTIVSFDIPEPERKLRRWLREQLKIYGYKMLQQSLWLGPGPLPDKFQKRLHDLKIRDRIKIFSRVRKTT